jgi:hypothetical protein
MDVVSISIAEFDMHITPSVSIFTIFTIFLNSNTILYKQLLFPSNMLVLKQYINFLSISKHFSYSTAPTPVRLLPYDY